MSQYGSWLNRRDGRLSRYGFPSGKLIAVEFVASGRAVALFG